MHAKTEVNPIQFEVIRNALPGLQSDQGRNKIETPYHSLVGREVTSHNTTVPGDGLRPSRNHFRGSGTARTIS